MAEEAAAKGHSTVTEAAQIARQAGARRLAITHVSPRYVDSSPLLAQAQAIFPDTLIAEDLTRVEIFSRDELLFAQIGVVKRNRVAIRNALGRPGYTGPGPIPEPLDIPSEGARASVPRPRPEHVAKADSLVRVIRDEDLRKVVAKAAALSLASADNDRSFW